ncbi:Polyketide biosynthesis 3-hydroxy-3-methylglutaryl-ACP synthase PksG [Paraliobacillus sp. PM-2]|uniref:hydroxymethylglutaryl-CoA synthase n=1 Tax=Paraliobacillus sp. PM-2 TaxID=1462524 RepID=UPI00061C8E4C|nr:hydroxymethylglutaryl-CoA synthase [Paraliobacillus sp. PM-2]CQR47547.1 Polyketide biosynthesis 3-hydroxy-3-methylglutaryl-ACP synthase PksG [Paraliobacillus sp. PM-2]
MKIGIDKIGFYTPHMYVETEDLAVARNIEPGKFTIGIGQEKIAVPPITQDAVSLAANAALQIVTDEDKEAIDYVIFATESGIDHSKAASIYIHQLLDLNRNTRSIEVKQACYSATAGIQMAKGHIALNPESKVLILGADISRYGLQTSGEVTQGAGAVAMIMSAEPKIMTVESPSAYQTEDVMDFWRPLYSDTAFVQGKYSVDKYIGFFQELFSAYTKKTGVGLHDLEAILFHLPYTKMGMKALKSVLEDADETDKERLLANFDISKKYNATVGNIYTGSLYLSLISLLEGNTNIESGARIGLFSYGSGAVGEFFTGILQPNYRENIYKQQHEQMLADRTALTVAAYEEHFQNTLPVGVDNIDLPTEKDPATICFAGIKDHMRQYVRKDK